MSPTRFVRRVQNYLPIKGYRFARPLVLFQSDDWGLCGIPDRAGFDALRAAGIALGGDAYDYHSLETADDLHALYHTLAHHHDELGRPPTFVCNFIVTNVNCADALATGLTDRSLIPLDAGLPDGWHRPGLWEAYRQGIAGGFVYPAFHGLTHFCQRVAAHNLTADSVNGALLRMLYQHNTPLLYSQARWLSFEYKDDTTLIDEGWLDQAAQSELIAAGTAHFQRIFGISAISACAPGYRANVATRRAWHTAGVRVAQNGPGFDLAPHMESGGLLMLYRNVSLEPAIDPLEFTDANALADARRAIAAGKPVIVSMHAVNFHSTIQNNRDETLKRLDEFLTKLETEFPTLRYVHDEDIWNIVQRGVYDWQGHSYPIKQRSFWQKSPALASR
jgi:hypothetical protein